MLHLPREERMSVAEQENMLGTMPVGRLVLRMSWPVMLSMLMQAVYNLVDSVYVAQLGDEAFLALSYAYPIQTLMAAFCVGVGVGFSAAFSRRLGEGKKEAASTAAIHGFLLYFACFLIFLAFGLWGCRAYLHTCTQTAQVVEQGVAYLQICCCLSLGMCLQFPCERVLQSTGHPAGFMIIQGSGALINILLDPIFIFVLDLEVRGAAIATVVGQISGGIIGLFLIRRIRSQFVCPPDRVRCRATVFRDIPKLLFLLNITQQQRRAVWFLLLLPCFHLGDMPERRSPFC